MAPSNPIMHVVLLASPTPMLKSASLLAVRLPLAWPLSNLSIHSQAVTTFPQLPSLEFARELTAALQREESPCSPMRKWRTAHQDKVTEYPCMHQPEKDCYVIGYRLLFSLTAFICFITSVISVTCQAAGPTIILIHGVESSGNPNDLWYPYLPMKKWLKDNASTATIIDFDWAEGTRETAGAASIQIGARGDVVSGMSEKAWSGADSLNALIKTQTGKVLIIIAHSQGTALTLGALQDTTKVYCVVLMGTPLYRGFMSEPLRGASKNVEILINLASTDDTTVSAPEHIKKAIDGNAAGRFGLPNLSGGGFSQIKNGLRHNTYLNLRDGHIVEDIIVTGVTHAGDKGWWSGCWLNQAEVWPSSYTHEKLKKIFSCVPNSPQ